MSEYHEMQREAAIARIGADRMALGLGCIPDPLRGDMAKVAQFRHEIERLRAQLVSDINAETEIDRLENENGRLRAALKPMVEHFNVGGGKTPIGKMLEEARKALEGK